MLEKLAGMIIAWLKATCATPEADIDLIFTTKLGLGFVVMFYLLEGDRFGPAVGDLTICVAAGTVLLIY